ncbi:MAG: hypothetical protein KatS3mg062_1349 [Tepidiforma sp.]|nr:MAG: hypothetical protein KatS3mg062_1349 [Tepidiforma sp.]
MPVKRGMLAGRYGGVVLAVAGGISAAWGLVSGDTGMAVLGGTALAALAVGYGLPRLVRGPVGDPDERG